MSWGWSGRQASLAKVLPFLMMSFSLLSLQQIGCLSVDYGHQSCPGNTLSSSSSSPQPLPHTCPPMHVLCLTEIKIKCEKAKGCCSCFSSDIIVFTFILWTFMWSWHLQHPLCIFSLVADVKPSSLFLCLFVDAALFRSQFYRCLCSCLF